MRSCLFLLPLPELHPQAVGVAGKIWRAQDLGINGTPAIVLSKGRRLEGAIPADKLEALLGGT